MDKKNFVITATVVWLAGAISLIGIHKYLNRIPKTPDYVVKGRALIDSLEESKKIKFAYLESALIRLNDGSLQLIGAGSEATEAGLLNKNLIFKRKLSIQIDDPILVERQAMVTEAFKKLNNAEKRCIQDRYATFLYSQGDYYLVLDSSRYSEYVKRYGTLCETCGQAKRP
jgi:hypothetical protein